MRALPLWVRGELSPKVGINENLGWECSRAAQKPVRETGKKIWVPAWPWPKRCWTSLISLSQRNISLFEILTAERNNSEIIIKLLVIP